MLLNKNIARYLNRMETIAIDAALCIEDLQVKKAALILRAVNHKLRQQMLRLIHQNEEMTVTSLYVKLRLEQSVASQHLAILRKAKFVNTRRDGKCVYYSVNEQRLNQIHQIAAQLIS